MTSQVPAAPRQLTPAEAFRRTVESTATSFLKAMVGEERAREAAGKLSVALRQLGLTTPKLYECTQESVAQSIAMCALTGLNPGGAYPGCYLIPRNQSVNTANGWQKVMRMNWQLSWRGMLSLAKRAGWDVRCYVVHREEPLELSYEPEPRVTYRPNPDVAVTKWDELRGCVVYATNRDRGITEAMWVPRAIIEARRDASETYKNSDRKDSVWHLWPVEMAMKAAIRYAVSRGLVPMDDEWNIAETVDLRSDSATHETIDVTAQDVEEPAVLDAPPETVEAAPVAEAVRAAKPHGMDALGAALAPAEKAKRQAKPAAAAATAPPPPPASVAVPPPPASFAAPPPPPPRAA